MLFDDEITPYYMTLLINIDILSICVFITSIIFINISVTSFKINY